MTVMFSKIRTAHHINMDELYPKWGLAGYSCQEVARENLAFKLATATSDEIQQGMAIFSKSNMPLDEFILSHAVIVPFYQGSDQDDLQSNILLRFTRKNGVNNHIGGEHISAVIDLVKAKLLGAGRLLMEGEGSDYVLPDVALAKALNFLTDNSGDLPLSSCSQFSMPNEIKVGQGIDVFSRNNQVESVGFDLGSLSLLWIDTHTEQVETDKIGETHGMKVKLKFNDQTERYAWVIIDSEGIPNFFERNIFWNFDQFKRETQMWLHDGWLKAHSIDLAQCKIL